MIKKITKTLGAIVLGIPLVFSPVRADEIKTMKYNDYCTATYSLDKIKDRYKIFNIECDDGMKLYNPDGDDEFNEICDKGVCLRDHEENKELFDILNYELKENIPEAIMAGEIVDNIEKMNNELKNSLQKNQPKTNLEDIGNW